MTAPLKYRWNSSQVQAGVRAFIYETQIIDGEPVEVVVGERPGFRVNLDPVLMVPAWEPYRVNPARPACVFAGLETTTVFLEFVDEDQAAAAMPVHAELIDESS